MFNKKLNNKYFHQNSQHLFCFKCYHTIEIKVIVDYYLQQYQI